MDVIQMIIALLDILDATTTAIGLLALWDMWIRPQQDHHQPVPNDIEANNHHLKWWFETLRLNRSKRFGLRITC